MKLSKEIKTAILVVSGIILVIFGYNYLKGQNLLDASRSFFVVYDNVEGISASTPVTINGFPVGKVANIGFTDDNSGQILIKLLVNNDFEFSKNSRAELYETGLIGGKAIAIIPAFDGDEKAKNDTYLKGTVKAGLTELVNQRLTPLQEKIEKMMVSADSVLIGINNVLNEDTQDNLKASVSSLSVTLESFAQTSKSIEDLLANNKQKLNTTVDNFEKISTNLTKATNAIAKTDIDQTVSNLEATIKNFNTILAKVESGEGSIGKLLKDDNLYNNLEGASLQLEQLLEDLKLNPKRYVHFSLFGKKAKQYDAEGNEIKQPD